MDRVLEWADRRPERVRGHNPWQVAILTARGAVRHHITGRAAEMSFFALLALVPMTVAVGVALGLIERVVGAEKIARGQNAALTAVRAVMSPRLTEEVIDPFVRAQLSPQRGGVALGGLLLTWWLASHLFTATSHALDRAYGVKDEHVPTIGQHVVALAFAVASVVVVVLTLGMMVDAPFVDEGQIARQFGLGRAVALAWAIGRWPMLLLVLVGFLVCIYRFMTSVRHTWRECLPGAVLAMLLWILTAVGFRIYLALGGGAPTGVVVDDERVVIIGRAVGAVVATVLWTYFSSIAILLGGELNAQLARVRSARREAAGDRA